MKKLIDYALRLLIICIAASGLLAYVYQSTASRIEENVYKEKLLKAKEVLSGRADEIKKVDHDGMEFFRGFSKNVLVGTVIETSGTGYGGPIRVLSGIGTDGRIIEIAILSHKETPGLGSKADTPWFKKQFISKGASGVRLKKDLKPGDMDGIDAITSATITSRAVSKAVGEALAEYEKVKNVR